MALGAREKVDAGKAGEKLELLQGRLESSLWNDRLRKQKTDLINYRMSFDMWHFVQPYLKAKRVYSLSARTRLKVRKMPAIMARLPSLSLSKSSVPSAFLSSRCNDL